MKIALIQLDIRWEDKKTNCLNAERLLGNAAELGSDIAVLPEMFNTGFSMEVASIAEDEDGETARFLSGTARKYGINLVAGFPARSSVGEKGRNVAHAYDREGVLLATYTKIHPFSFSGEDRFYEAGRDTVTFNLDGMACSVFICYDLRFPEVFRNVSAEAVFVIANWPSERIEHWNTLLKARAIENQCFVIGVNRTGKGGNGLYYPGSSRVFGPTGLEVCSGGETDELLVCEIDPGKVGRVRAEFPFLKDRRTL
jgi:predicted amidohydrolase